MLSVGFGTACITPPLPCRLAGYSRRQGLSWQVSQQLWARALVLDNGDTRVGWVVCDLLYASRALVAEVRAAIDATGCMPGQDVMVGSTHTHAGPDLSGDWGCNGAYRDAQERYTRFLPHAIASAVVPAVVDLEPCSVGWAESALSGVGSGRREENGLRPQKLGALKATVGDRLKGMVIVYPCHGTVLGPENLAISGDIIGAYVEGMENSTGAPGRFAWAQGAAGDISTRDNRRERSEAEVARLGALVADAAKAAAARSEPVDAGDHLELSRVEVPLPTKGPEQFDGPDMAGPKKRDEGDRSPEALIEEGMAARAARRHGSREVEDVAELSCLWVGKLPLCFMPGEPFESIERALVQMTGLEGLRVVGYTNGAPGYIFGPDEEAEGGYEVMASPLTGQAGTRLVAAAAKLVGSRSWS
jgi:neutral ceramidase